MTKAKTGKVEHLVLDAAPVIDDARLKNLASHFYAPQEVMNELRDEQTRRNMLFLPFEIIIREPTVESLKLEFLEHADFLGVYLENLEHFPYLAPHSVAEEAKKTGDYKSLSLPDMKVIALTVDLHRDYHIAVGTASAEDCVQGEPEKVEIPAMGRGGHLPDGFCVDEVDSSDDEGWITADNVSTANGMQMEIDDVPKVGCFTSDFAVQNVLLAMKLHLVSIEGKRIARINSYIQRCRACLQTCSDNTKNFCPKCGNKSLHKCAVSVDANGEQRLHISYRRLAVTRGLRYSMPAPKGGKHTMQEQIFEDQRLPHLRPARVRAEKPWDEPFAVHDVTSRSAALGVRVIAKKATQPSAGRGGGKRRGSKR